MTKNKFMQKELEKLKKFRKFFKRLIIENCGKKCCDYCFNCIICRT